MRNWEIDKLELEPHKPMILSSSDAARVVAIALPAGERLQEHEVHERAWLTVIAGEVEIEAAGTTNAGGPGFVTEFDPQERHEVRATSNARLLLLLAPWPGAGHPGAMTLEEKAHVRERAREHTQ